MASLGEIVVSQLDAAFIDLAGPALCRPLYQLYGSSTSLCSCDWLYLPPLYRASRHTGATDRMGKHQYHT